MAFNLLGCCDRFILTSTGDTLDYNSVVLGTYKAVGVSNGRSLYKNEIDNDSHLHFNSKNEWMVCTGYCIGFSPILVRKQRYS